LVRTAPIPSDRRPTTLSGTNRSRRKKKNRRRRRRRRKMGCSRLTGAGEGEIVMFVFTVMLLGGGGVMWTRDESRTGGSREGFWNVEGHW
jgi:hypothetical protein